MSGKELSRRYLVFFFSLWINGLGVALVTLAALGTTPISSAWYEISLHTPLSFGMVTMLGNLLLIASQYFLLPDRHAKGVFRSLFSQIPATFLFSVSIDVNMFLMAKLVGGMEFYLARLTLLFAGSVILACGVALEVRANVALVAGEAFVKALCLFLKKDFGIIKLCFDVSLVLLAIVVGLIATDFGAVASVREGTVIGALLVGPCVRVVSRHLAYLDRFFGESAHEATPAPVAVYGPVITISREYGCGGRLLGKRLAQDLGLKFYDSEIIDLTAKETGMTPEYVSRHEERLDNALLYQMIFQDYTASLDKSLSETDALYVAQARVIRRLAAQGPCVIVGRGADDLLSDYPQVLKIRLYASFEDKLRRCLEEYHMTREAALKAMELFDRRRAEHYAHYTGRDINDPHNYQLTLNVGALGLEECAVLIEKIFTERFA